MATCQLNEIKQKGALTLAMAQKLYGNQKFQDGHPSFSSLGPLHLVWPLTAVWGLPASWPAGLDFRAPGPPHLLGLWPTLSIFTSSEEGPSLLSIPSRLTFLKGVLLPEALAKKICFHSLKKKKERKIYCEGFPCSGTRSGPGGVALQWPREGPLPLCSAGPGGEDH